MVDIKAEIAVDEAVAVEAAVAVEVVETEIGAVLTQGSRFCSLICFSNFFFHFSFVIISCFSVI